MKKLFCILFLAFACPLFGQQETVKAVPTFVQLRLLNPNDLHKSVLVRGGVSENDGLGGEFFWSFSSADAADNTNVVLSSRTGTGRWLRIAKNNGSIINVKLAPWKATGNGVTDDQTAIQGAINTITNSGGTIYIPEGTYIIQGLNFYGSNIRVMGDGSGRVTLKRKAGSVSNNGMEFGVLADGNSAVPTTNNSVVGITLDGNYLNTTRPVSDLTEWGIGLTKSSYFYASDVVCRNWWLGGIGVFINSNYAQLEGTVINCGHGFDAGAGVVYEPGFDINSSKNGHFRIISIDCRDGARVLDNCFENVVHLSITNATTAGVIYNNQLVNESHGNIIHATVTGGAGSQGMAIGANCRNSIIHLTTYGIGGRGIYEIGGYAAENKPSQNKYFVNTRGSGYESAFIGGVGGTWVINSDRDGRTGGQGDLFAVEVLDGASQNQISVNIVDTDPWKVRGVVFRYRANNNILTSYAYLNTADPYRDLGVGNEWLGRANVGTIAGTMNILLSSRAAGTTYNGTIATFKTDNTGSATHIAIDYSDPNLTITIPTNGAVTLQDVLAKVNEPYATEGDDLSPFVISTTLDIMARRMVLDVTQPDVVSAVAAGGTVSSQATNTLVALVFDRTFNITNTDTVILVDTSAGNWTVNTRTPVYVLGRSYTVKKITGDSNTVTISGPSSTFDSSASVAFSAQWEWVTFVSDLIGYYITSR